MVNKSMEVFKFKFGFQTGCVLWHTALPLQHRFVCASIFYHDYYFFVCVNSFYFLDKIMNCPFLLIYLYLFSLTRVPVERRFLCSNIESKYFTLRHLCWVCLSRLPTWVKPPEHLCKNFVWSARRDLFIHQDILEDVLQFSFLVWIGKNHIFIKIRTFQQDTGQVSKKSGNLDFSFSLPKFPTLKSCFVQHEFGSWLSASVSQWKSAPAQRWWFVLKNPQGRFEVLHDGRAVCKTLFRQCNLRLNG